MEIVHRARALAEEKIVEFPGLFLVEVKMLPGNKLIILVDGDGAVTISECAAISRHVGFHLEEENVMDVAYNLEVGSPGVGEPLRLKRQYVKNIGRNLAIVMQDGTKREGKLIDVDDEHILIEELVAQEAKPKSKKKVVVKSTISLQDISETKVLISFK